MFRGEMVGKGRRGVKGVRARLRKKEAERGMGMEMEMEMEMGAR